MRQLGPMRAHTGMHQTGTASIDQADFGRYRQTPDRRDNSLSYRCREFEEPVAAIGAPQIDNAVTTTPLRDGVGAVDQHDFMVAEYGVKPFSRQEFRHPVAFGAAVDQVADREKPIQMLVEADRSEE